MRVLAKVGKDFSPYASGDNYAVHYVMPKLRGVHRRTTEPVRVTALAQFNQNQRINCDMYVWLRDVLNDSLFRKNNNYAQPDWLLTTDIVRLW